MMLDAAVTPIREVILMLEKTHVIGLISALSYGRVCSSVNFDIRQRVFSIGLVFNNRSLAFLRSYSTDNHS